MLDFIISCLYFFAPAYFANITPAVIAKILKIKFLDVPIDFGKKWRGKPIFGSHKTWRGLFFGFSIGIVVVFIQFFLYKIEFFRKISFLNYSEIDIILFAVLISSGAVLGDLFFSFLKRRFSIKPGENWIPFDQIGFAIGSLLFVNYFFSLTKEIWITILVLSFILHILFNILAYYLGLQKNKL